MTLLLLVALPLLVVGLAATVLPLVTALVGDHSERRRIVAAGGSPPLSVIERKDARRRAPVDPAGLLAEPASGEVAEVDEPERELVSA